MLCSEQNLLHSRPQKPVKSKNSPRFDRHQTVRFFGGTGKIKDIQRQDICWIYHVEMDKGVEPDFGRIGAETTIVLEEQDIRKVIGKR